MKCPVAKCQRCSCEKSHCEIPVLPKVVEPLLVTRNQNAESLEINFLSLFVLRAGAGGIDKIVSPKHEEDTSSMLG